MRIECSGLSARGVGVRDKGVRCRAWGLESGAEGPEGWSAGLKVAG